jgi:hypothetical protein
MEKPPSAGGPDTPFRGHAPCRPQGYSSEEQDSFPGPWDPCLPTGRPKISTCFEESFSPGIAASSGQRGGRGAPDTARFSLWPHKARSHGPCSGMSSPGMVLTGSTASPRASWSRLATCRTPEKRAASGGREPGYVLIGEALASGLGMKACGPLGHQLLQFRLVGGDEVAPGWESQLRRNQSPLMDLHSRCRACTSVASSFPVRSMPDGRSGPSGSGC